MFPLRDLNSIDSNERGRRGRRAIVVLLVKPSDGIADQLIGNFNYYHFASRGHCSIYAAGYGLGATETYGDAKKVCTVDGCDWWYSDRCFVEFQNQLSLRTKWRYCGEPEILILQTGKGKHSSLDFTNYVAIDVCQGLRQGYIDAVPRLMEGLLQASKEEVEAKSLIKEATRLSASNIAKSAIDICLDFVHCPTSLKTVLADRAFYRTSNRRS